MWERVNKLVRIRNLYKKYGSFSVLRGLSMDIEKGDVYGFLGRNGCGKTTTMNIITNIIPKDEGEIILGNGRPVKVGYLPESPTIYGYMTSSGIPRVHRRMHELSGRCKTPRKRSA